MMRWWSVRQWVKPEEMWIVYWSPLLVGLCSVVGLGGFAAMIGPVWAANLWADALFYVGTLVAIIATFRSTRQPQSLWLAWLYAPLFHLAVYLVSAMFMLGALADDRLWRFLLPVPDGVQGMTLVFTVGWPGLLVHAVVGAAIMAGAAAGRRKMRLASSPPTS